MQDVSRVAIPDPHMDGVTFSVLRLDGSFVLKQPVMPTVNFYFVRRGKVFFESGSPIVKRAVLTPNACTGLSARIPHSFKSTEIEAGQSDPVIRTEAMGTADHGESVEIVVGSVPEESLLYVRAFQEVPIIYPESAPGIADNIRRAVDWIEFESSNPQADTASKAIVRRIAEIISLNFGRFRTIVQPELVLSTHGANIDKRIMRVLTAIYRKPEFQWTLQSLAQEANMSRTAFAARYRELMGTTPLQGLQRLRLRRAADQLMNSPSMSIDRVAANWGYQSAAVFIRAFTREYGVSPGRWRHSAILNPRNEMYESSKNTRPATSGV